MHPKSNASNACLNVVRVITSWLQGTDENMPKPKKPKKIIELGPGKCNLCPRHLKTKNICIPGYGPAAPKLVCIAESPSTTEDVWCRICQKIKTKQCETNPHPIGQPLVGPAGKLLRKALAEAGFDEHDVYYTNVVWCSGGTPKMPEARKCSLYWKEELAKLDYSQCVAIVILGEFALKAITDDGHAKISEARLRRLNAFVEALEGPRSDDLDSGNTKAPSGLSCLKIPQHVPIFATYHPSAALPHHDSGKYDEIVSDLENIWKIRDPIRPVALVDQAKELGRYFKKKPEVLSLDLEWKSTGELRMGGVSDGKTNAVVKDVRSVIEWLENSRA